MSRASRLIVGFALLLPASAGLLAQSSECAAVRFSEEVLARFPRAADACLDVIQRDGNEYAVFKAQLESVSGRTLRVRMKLPDGSHANAMNIQTKQDLRVLIDGEPARVQDLAPDQELTAYVRVDRPELALAPADPAEPLYTVPLPEPVATASRVAAAEEPSMPATASALETLPLLALLLGVIATVAAWLRRRPQCNARS